MCYLLMQLKKVEMSAESQGQPMVWASFRWEMKIHVSVVSIEEISTTSSMTYFDASLTYKA